jgi:hypothetical protein
MQDEKIKKSLIIESRLKLLLLALQHKDSDIVEVIVSKILEQNDLDKEIVDIITNIEFNLRFKQFEHSINEINDYLNKKTITIVKYEDKELKELKQQLKNLEIRFQELIEQKTEYLNDIEEFNTQYSLHLGELIKTILNLKKEILYKKTIKNQKLKEQYKTNKNICDETKQTIDELKNTVSELEEILENIDKDDENYEEISSAYNEIKEELEKLEDELILQEEKLEKTQEELKENEIFEEEYEEAKATYEEFDNEYEHIKDTQKDVIKLDEEQQKELKILYKKAAKLCHPDIVADELKEKAHEIMQSLNDAYSKKDISQVKKILLSLENGTTFKTVSSDIEDKELLLNKIKEFEQNISDLKDEIEILKDDDTFITISSLDNWDEYFEELKTELQKEKDMLENEARRVLEEKEEVEEWIQKLWNWADENNISNGKLSRKKENLLAMTTIDFTGLKLKNICKEIFNLKNISTFSLWDNDISFLPNEIVNFTNLKKLNLRGNSNLEITQTQKDWIDNLKDCTIYMDEIKLKNNSNNINIKHNFYAHWLEGTLIDVKNIINISFHGYTLILHTKYDGIVEIYTYKNIEEAIEDKDLYENILKNPECAVILIKDDGRFKAFDSTSEEYKILRSGLSVILENEVEDDVNNMDIENSDYSKALKNIENPNFEKIRRYCNNLQSDNKADEMQKYLAENGKMHKALIYDALEQFISKLDGKTITLVDWGCEQGIGSSLVLDYIKEKQLNIKIEKVVLIDDNEKVLSRAMAHIDTLLLVDKIEIIPINSNELGSLDKIKTIQNSITINLFTNDKMPIDFFDMDFDLFDESYFMCLSNENDNFINEVYENFEMFINIQNVSMRDTKIGKFKKFERIFKISNFMDIDIDEDEIPF